MSAIFANGQGVIVSARGPGSLHLLTTNPVIDPNLALPVVGAITTTPSMPDKITRFMISFSHNYTKFAFYWDGNGQAVYGEGQDLVRQPVGKGWDAATTVNWGSTSFSTEDVRTLQASATNRGNVTTIFIIPDNLL